MLWGGWGERKRECAGHDEKGKEKREASGSCLFPLPIVPGALSIFSIITIFRGIPSRSLCGGERESVGNSTPYFSSHYLQLI